MKFCSKCGNQLADGAAFCPKCGHRNDVHTVKVTQKKNKTGKKAIVTICSIFAVIVIAVLGFIFYKILTYDASAAILAAIKIADSEEAAKIYENKVEGKKSLEFEVKRDLENFAEEFLTEYNEETLLQADAEGLIYTLDDSNILNSMTIEGIYNEFSNLLNSKYSYNSAENYFEKEDYLSAITDYKWVDENDTNYDDAQAKIKECESLYKNKSLESITKAMEDNDFETAFTLIGIAFDEMGEDEDLVNLNFKCESAYENYNVEKAISSAKALLEEKEFALAYRTLLQQTYIFENNQALEDELEICKKMYVDSTLELAKATYDDGGFYELSIDIIEEALLDIPDDIKLINHLSLYKSYRPDWIRD